MKSLVAGACCAGMLCAGFGAGRLDAQTLGGGVVGWRSDSLRPTDDWNTFSADMRVKRSHVRKNGTAIGALVPDALYRIERSKRSGSWKSVITVLSVTQPARFALSGAMAPSGAFAVQRLENDEDGTPVRAYDMRGARIRSYTTTAAQPIPSTPLPPRSVGREWLYGMVAIPVNKPQRQQAFERSYGRATATSTALLYTKQDGTRTQQLLVDPVNVVPLEATDLQNGVRHVRTTFRYGSAGGAGLVRLGTRTEVLVSSGVDDVTIVDSSFSNIRLERR